MSYTYNEQRNSKKCIQNTTIYPIVMKSCTLTLVWSDALVSFASFSPMLAGTIVASSQFVQHYGQFLEILLQKWEMDFDSKGYFYNFRIQDSKSYRLLTNCLKLLELRQN